MATSKKETVFLVSCYDLQAHALRRQARAWRQAGYAVELLFFKRPGLIPFSHQEANLLAQEVRQAAPRCVGLFAPEENHLQPVLRFLRSEVQETPLYLGDDLPAPTPTADQLPLPNSPSVSSTMENYIVFPRKNQRCCARDAWASSAGFLS